MYTIYLLISLVAQVIAWVITPLLPLFAVLRDGWSDNHNVRAVEPRLPSWLSWFDTPDNSLFGDKSWRSKHDGGYWSQVAWLYRNSLYGFKWTVLSREVQTDREVVGSTDINYHTNKYGSLFIYQHNGAWQYKCVKKLPFGKIFIGNFGWLLDDTEQSRALFMFSPRIK